MIVIYHYDFLFLVIFWKKTFQHNQGQEKTQRVHAVLKQYYNNTNIIEANRSTSHASHVLTLDLTLKKTSTLPYPYLTKPLSVVCKM